MKSNYLQILNNRRFESKFDLLYESVMKGAEIYPHIKTTRSISNHELNIILEEIEKPQYVICESSGKSILLEEAIFLPEDYLISEGIFDKIGEKIKKIIDWIKEGIKKVISEASDKIKAFCEKVKNNPVVAAIRKKLGLDEKLKSEKFKSFVKVTAKGKEVAVESFTKNINGTVITEATKLNKKEEAITDPKELEPIIKKWEDALSGKAPINNKKTGKPLSTKYCKEKLRLLKKKLASLQQGGGEGKTDAKNLKVTNDTEKAENTNITVDGNKKEGDEKGEKKPIGDLKFDVEGMKNVVISVKDESTNDDAINNAAQGAAPAMGEVIDGDSAPPKEEKKKGFLGKLGDMANKVGKKIKETTTNAWQATKKWFNSQNKVVKILICAIIAVLAIVGIYFLFTAVIWPILYGILHGGIINAAIGIFRIYASGKTFVATYKQGKKSWESGEGWGKTFLMIGMSILAIVNLGQMAAQGNAMMAADAAKNASNAAGEAAAEGGKSAAGGGGKNPFDLDGNGRLTRSELMKMMKENKIPGMDLNDPRYTRS